MHIRLLIIISAICLCSDGTANAEVSSDFPDSIERALLNTKGIKSQVDLLLSSTRKLRSTDPDRALNFATRALSIASANDLSELKLRALIEMGNLQTLKSRFPQGMEMGLNAKDLAIKLHNDKGLADALLIIGMIKDFQGNYSESYDAHFSALRLFEGLNDKEGIVKALNGIGNICYYQNNYVKAFLYYSKALNIARKMNDNFQVANVINNVGLVLVEQGQIAQAIDCYNEAIAIHKRMGLKIRLATNYINLGSAYLKLNRFDDFLLNYEKGIEIYKSFGSSHNLALCYIDYSEYYRLIKDKQNQIKFIMMAYSLGRQYKLRDVIFQACSVLHETYLSEGKIDSTYKYAMLQNAEKDSIDNEHSTARLTLLEMEYNYDKKQKEESLKQQRKDFITIIIVILAISGLLIVLLILSRQIIKMKNIRLEKQNLADEVDLKNKEITVNVMNLLKKNEFLVEHTNRLIEVQQKATEDHIKTDILHLINSLQRGTKEEIWDEFELRFKQVHSGYYDRLLAKFCDLTSNELKLCALLRLNLTTKEICELTGQRPASLDVARSRLRRKLGLPSSQTNLVTFLSQI
jgi:tetratricopeptide (TPR) repeat protein